MGIYHNRFLLSQVPFCWFDHTARNITGVQIAHNISFGAKSISTSRVYVVLSNEVKMNTCQNLVRLKIQILTVAFSIRKTQKEILLNNVHKHETQRRMRKKK